MKSIDKYISLRYSQSPFIKYYFLMAVFAISIVFSSCDSDEDQDFMNAENDLAISEITGTWVATIATVVAPHDIDILAEGAKISITINPNGNFRFSLKLPDEAEEIHTGKLSFDGKWLSVNFDDDPGGTSFFMSYVNDIPTLRGEVAFDLNRNTSHYIGILKFTMERS